MLSQTHTNTQCDNDSEREYIERKQCIVCIVCLCVCSCAADTEPMKNVAAASAVARNPPADRGWAACVCVCVCVCDSVCMLSQYRECKALTPQPFYSIFIFWCRQTHSRGHAINQYQYDRCVRVCIYVCMCTLTQLKTIKGIVHPKILNLSSFAHFNIIDI